MASHVQSEGARSVVNSTDRRRFEVLEGDQLAYLEYELFKDKVVFKHTEVPLGLEGRGLGGALARNALDWARTEGLRVIPVCPFVAAWIARHPDYAELTRRTH